ncbi:hypothetical protein [Frankia sp. KB5]|uniref:hypothetical protein n=1 Tax=Frankia sp. KB5 TaxID=683318 RepID=UPI000A1037E1|nr:hypothetical protein [Frankia sp. KB5]ORT47186.1 hypothetical protein KBI5_21145 [Frankia sp. KB5]
MLATTARPATFAALFATAYAAHQLADHVVGQTDAQAAAKAAPGRAGWTALGRHVGAYHAVMAGMVAVTARTVGMPVTGRGLAAGLAVSAATHALWDRRTPVRWIQDHTGSADFARLADHGLNGAYLSDQALHVGSLWAAALVAVAIGTR